MTASTVHTSDLQRAVGRLALAAAIAASAGPLLLAYNVSPSPTFLNQALAIVLWGWFVIFLARGATGSGNGGAVAGSAALWAALLLTGMAAIGSWLIGRLPSSLALSGAGLLLAAIVLVISGSSARRGDAAANAFGYFCWGWVVAGVLNAAIALLQVFMPDLPDGDWIAASGIPGRAVGNIRQPNHLSSLLLWSAIAVIALVEMRRLRSSLGAALFATMVFAVLLTASRTGMVSVVLLAVWGVVDRRLTRGSRGLLLTAPVIYALGWAGMAWWAQVGQHAFGGTARLAEADVSGSRFAIWSNTVELIRREPWTGVGFGEFNFAWTLTPFPHRPIAFFDHAHNLPLQLAVELGLPLAAMVMLLLLVALWQLWRNCRAADPQLALTHRCALLMVLMIGLHSLLEYPLWYAYFLLPAAWAWGYGLGRSGDDAMTAMSRSPGLVVAGLMLVAAGAMTVADYARVVPIFEAPENAAPLAQRIAAGKRSVFFSHHADYAAATTDIDPALQIDAFAGATHYLLDTRLMMAWAEALAAQGRMDLALHLVARLKEFHNPASQQFLGICDDPRAPKPPPFQCQGAQRVPHWREYMRP